MAIVPITPESEWLLRLQDLPPFVLPRQHTLIISPHPDDETLGAGGLIYDLCQAGIEVSVVAVTDGENAYPDEPGQAAVRETEQTCALARLGVDRDHIHRLRFRDSGLSSLQSQLRDSLQAVVADDMHLVAPWTGDFHPDHEACGHAAAALSAIRCVPVTSYFFWTWHRGTPATLDGMALSAYRMTAAAKVAKDEALACHRSQLSHSAGDPILPEILRAPARRNFEVYLS